MNQVIQDRFLVLVDSLRKYQRAELIEDGEDLIEKLYTDPFDNNFVLKTMLLNQTTILIGRKGTGKSTIINRFQNEIRKTKDSISLYIDVKSIYIQARESTPTIDYTDFTTISPEEIDKYFIYRLFLKKVIDEIKQELNKSLFQNKIMKAIFKTGITEQEFNRRLEAIFNIKCTFEDITALKSIKIKEEIEESSGKTKSKKLSGSLSPELKLAMNEVSGKIGELKASSSTVSSDNKQNFSSQEYADVLIRYYNIIDLMNSIRDELIQLGVKRVFLCLDDASELDRVALETFIRAIVVPLNNSSEGFYKFKISFYPGRDALPDIDRGKIETINLDYFKLYSSSGSDKVEEFAIDYTRRLILNRFKFYFGDNVDLSEFFDTSTLHIDNYYRLLFSASSNVPRFIGKILWYCAKQSIFQGKKITKSIIQSAAKQHYNDEIKVVLFMNEYIQYQDYKEKYEKEHLKNLVLEIIQRAKENKRQIGNSNATIFSKYTSNTAPSNYLFFRPEHEQLVASLELNFFITKYSQQKDRGRYVAGEYIPPIEQSVYTLNYGLCQNEDIIYDEGSDRKFRMEWVFDYNKLIESWAKSQKTIICTNCSAVHSLEKLAAIQSLGMICTNCGQHTCIVTTTEALVTNAKITIPEMYFQVLNVLKIENGLYENEIASELDKNNWAVRALVRADRLLQKDNYIIATKDNNRNRYYITPDALQIFYGYENE